MSCPYTSAQNGKAERIIRTINNVVHSLLFQASMPPSYWVEALSTATVLLKILPTKTLQFFTPHFALFAKLPHLRVFGCTCYPNLSATASHKLAPRSALCVFLGYSAHHKGYRCLDLSSNRVIISRHVIFDETTFSFAERHVPAPQPTWNFLILLMMWCQLLLDPRTLCTLPHFVSCRLVSQHLRRSCCPCRSLCG